MTHAADHMPDATTVLTCEAAEEFAQRSLDAALPAPAAAALARHHAGCAACRDEADALARVTRAVRALPRPAAPRDLEAQVVARLAAAGRPRSITLLARIASRAAAGIGVAVAVGMLMWTAATTAPTATATAPKSLAALRIEADRLPQLLDLFVDREAAGAILVAADQRLGALDRDIDARFQRISGQIAVGDGPELDVRGLLGLLGIEGMLADLPESTPNPGLWSLDDTQWAQVWSDVRALARATAERSEVRRAAAAELRGLTLTPPVAESRERLDHLLPD